jgi:hypothetical protein
MMAGYTLTQLEALEAAIASGQLEVKFGDKSIKYQTLGDMQKLRNEMRSELAASGAFGAIPVANQRVALASFSKD